MGHRSPSGASAGEKARPAGNSDPFRASRGTQLDRRTFFTLAGGAGLAVAANRVLPARAQTGEQIAEPFTLGVASGDPMPDSVVLWTRLAPNPLEGDGGMPQRPFPVQWQLALDEGMTRVIRSGSGFARPEFGHSVHVEVPGLEPGRWYWYRFRTQGHVSPVGRTRTAPVGLAASNLRFAFVSCQNHTQGFYGAFRDIAEQDFDVVMHLGDYIYEGGAQGSLGRGHLPAKEITSLDEYRIRYSQYKSDPQLQAAHAAAPFLATFDDHEVDNNWAGDIPQDPESQSRDEFLARRAVAFQAFYEHQPLRRSALPEGPDMLAYRRFTFGDLAEFSLLDTRQYRSDQPCDDGIKVRCPTALAPDQTLTGPSQERWLLDGLDRSTARWNVITQQVYMVEYKFVEDDEDRYNMDKWDG
jgi:alkaline phosphatase D